MTQQPATQHLCQQWNSTATASPYSPRSHIGRSPPQPGRGQPEYGDPHASGDEDLLAVEPARAGVEVLTPRGLVDRLG